MSNSRDFTQGNIFKKLISFMIPVLGALFLQAMYGAVDILIVSWFGSDAGISGVSTGSNITATLTFTISAFTMAVTVLIGQYLGEKNKEKVSKIIGGAIAFFAVVAVIVSLLTVIFAKDLAILMKAPAEAVQTTIDYVVVCGCGFTFIIAYNFISSIFRGLGNSKLPLLFVAIACVVNILGDLLFVALLGLDALGAALATVLAQAVSVICSLIILSKQELPFELKLKDIRFNKEIKKIIKVGGPMAFQEVMVSLSFMALCAFINALGLDASNGYGIACKITNFILLIPSSLMQSISAFVAQNVGARNPKRARQALYTGMGIGVSIGVVITVCSLFFGKYMAMIFSNDSVIINQASLYLKGFAVEAIFTAIIFPFMGYFSAHGKTNFVMAQSLAQTFIVRLPVALIMSLQPNATLYMIALAVPLSSFFGIILNVTYFRIFRKKARLQEI